MKEKKLELSDNALTVIKKRYLLKNEKFDPIETPLEMFERVVRTVSEVEKKYGKSRAAIKEISEQFFDVLTNLEFLPNSPTFTGAGTKLGQLSACFVLPIEDDMCSILKTQMDMGIIHKSGGGTGFSFSRLRPKNDLVGTTGGVSCGPLGFMQMYNDTTEQIKQGGTRRGANMGILRVDHPDILEFIDYKQKEGALSNFNISVALTDKFMRALKKNKSYELINPRTKKVVKKLKAKEVFDRIIENTWQNGEPGVIFIDQINKHNPTPEIGEIEATNPCGEQPLLPYESCNLGSVNLAKMIKTENDKIEIDWQKLEKTVQTAMRFLDNVIDVNRYPLPEIEEITKKNRKIGLGVMGFADLLFQLEIPYDSPRALSLAEELMKFISQKARKTSHFLAKEKGDFPARRQSIWAKQESLRNAAITTIAPTGTLSILASCSSGIEPVFALAYTKTVMDGTPLAEINPYVISYLKKYNYWSKEIEALLKKEGSLRKSNLPERVKKIWETALEISPEVHVKMQAAFQKYTDNAISKTINFPNQATKKDVHQAYLLAYELGCKGITIYRDGSRKVQVLTRGEEKKEETKPAELFTHLKPRPRPAVISGTTEEIPTSLGDLYVTINEDENGPFEVFARIGKSGGDAESMTEAIGRLVSLTLRSRIEIKSIIKQLKGIRGSQPVWQNGELILSCPDAIGKAIERYIKRKNTLNLKFAENQTNSQNITQLNIPLTNQGSSASLCPECGGNIEYEEGCLICKNCGFSKCG